VISEWLKAINPPSKRKKMIARWDAKIDHIRNLEKALWPGNLFTELTGFRTIWEMKFTLQNMQWRPLGFFGPGRFEFTFLIGAIERNGRFEPQSAPKLALERKIIVEADIIRIEELNLPVCDDD
jgi:hypothetical protein